MPGKQSWVLTVPCHCLHQYPYPGRPSPFGAGVCPAKCSHSALLDGNVDKRTAARARQLVTVTHLKTGFTCLCWYPGWGEVQEDRAGAVIAQKSWVTYLRPSKFHRHNPFCSSLCRGANRLFCPGVSGQTWVPHGKQEGPSPEF